MTTLKYWADDRIDLTFSKRLSPDGERLSACIQCGSCTACCPTANRMPVSPQHLTRLIRLGLETEVLDSRAFWLCTSCGACSAHCPRGIPILDLIIELKSYSMQHGRRAPEDVELLRETLQQTHNISGDPNDKRLGWSANLPQPLQSIESSNGADILYFVGCVGSFYPRAFSIPQAFGRILDHVGIRFTTLGENEWCCGYPLFTTGVKSDFGELVERNLAKVRELGVGKIVTTCPSCYHAWKVIYPRFAPLPSGLTIVHASQFLAELLDDKRIRPGILSQVVTYHDPCDLGRKSGEFDAPRHILKSLPGVEFRELANIRESSLCCGGGGDVKIFSHDTTMDVARRRVSQAIDIRADTIVSSCQQCKRAFMGALQAMRHPLNVVDVTALVWETMLDKVEW